MLRRYLIRDSYFSQIEGSAVVNIRLGYTCLGVAVWPPVHRREQGWLRRHLPLFDFAVWHHTGQRDVREIVRLAVCGRSIVNWRTKGETLPA